MTSLYYINEMLIPDRNRDIYSSLYEIENWLRRIALSAYMIAHGKEWQNSIDPKLSTAVLTRLKKNSELFYLATELDKNLIWATLHRELHQLIFDATVWPLIAEITHFGKERLQAKLLELNDIRNLLAHNRAFSSHTEVVFKGIEASIKVGVENFKNKIIYSNTEIYKDNDPDSVNTVFQRQMAGNDWGKFQAFLASNKYFYELVCLPVQRKWRTSYVSGRKLLKTYDSLHDSILAFNINKTGDEYMVLVPRNIPQADIEGIIETFVRNPDVWTDKPYEEQDPQYISNPKIWFYENRKPEPD